MGRVVVDRRWGGSGISELDRQDGRSRITVNHSSFSKGNCVTRCTYERTAVAQSVLQTQGVCGTERAQKGYHCHTQIKFSDHSRLKCNRCDYGQDPTATEVQGI